MHHTEKKSNIVGYKKMVQSYTIKNYNK